MNKPSSENNFAAEQAERLLSSFERLTGKSLIPSDTSSELRAQALYNAAHPVLSHSANEDPLLNYSNAKGMEQFEIQWEELIKLPSRYTAEPQTQEERNRLLKAVTDHGFIDDYQGVRISAKGNRFMVEDAIVWNVIDEDGVYWGQGAVLYKCRALAE
ncbi:MEKHLA domain-containing protein [Neptuniibacter sp. PT34_22]|uniref:MEKHLA domain-containing protein n=1 Tax=Neptuniibacter sp. PT34_22 TaxID=3398205 RepID=UPI0039F60F4F